MTRTSCAYRAVWLLAALAFYRATCEGIETLGMYTRPQQDGPTQGSCGYGDVSELSWPGSAILSINSRSSAISSLPLHGCGTCLKLTCASPASPSATFLGPREHCFNSILRLFNSLNFPFLQNQCGRSQSVTATVIDSDPDGSLAVRRSLFSKLTDPLPGQVSVKVEQVDCTPPDNMQLIVLQNRPSAGGYLKVAVFAARGSSIKSVELSSSGKGNWLLLNNKYGAVHEHSNLPNLPYDLRIINAADEQVIAENAITAATPASGIVPLTVQFSGVKSNISSSPSGPSADMVDTPPGDISDASTPGSWPPPMNAPPVPDASSVQEKSPRLSSAKHDAAKLANPVPPGPETLPAYPASPPNLEVSPESAASPEGAGGDQAGASYAPPVEAPAQCQTVWEVLQKRPALQSWVKLLQDANQENVLQDHTVQLTMFAPVNDALAANLPQGSRLGSGKVLDLLQRRPNIKTAVIGYAVAAGGQLTSSFSSSKTIVTTAAENTLKGQERLSIAVVGTDPLQLKSKGGNIATVQLPDIPACGPSYINTLNAVLLPA